MNLKIKETKWIVKVPAGAKILVKENEEIKRGEAILVIQKEKRTFFDASIVLSRIPKEKITEIDTIWKGKEVTEGELLYEEKGLFSRKVFSFCSGTFLGIDEFYNIHFEQICNEEKRTINSPIDAEVYKIEKDNITLSFRAFKFDGEGIIEGKVWADNKFKNIEKINDLNFSLENKIILTSNSDLAFVMKAEVVGVAGLIISKTNKKNFDKIETQLPILALDDREIGILISEFSKGEERRVLLNSRAGRLLISTQ